MPRPLRFNSANIAEQALFKFWDKGYGGTSIEELTSGIGLSRKAIYTAFPNKQALLLASADVYRRLIVDPAFSAVEQPGAGLAEIANYFETQISAADAAGLPGFGCLIANLATEVAPHDLVVAALVDAHLARLRKGFANALKNVHAGGRANVDGWASLLTATAQGLWSIARVSPNAEELRRPVAALLDLIKGAIAI